MARASAAAAKPRPVPKRAPAQPRRRSGPAAPPKGAPRKAGPAAARQPRTAAGAAVPRKPATTEWLASAIAVRGNLLLDRLLRGRLWVGCIGVLLAGIVFLNVGLLQLNDQIARTDKRSGTIGRENATLRIKLAKLDSTERIQRLAAAKGFVMPAPGAVRYLRAKPSDGRRAARETTAPEPRAPQLAAPAPQPAVPQTTTTAPPAMPQTTAPAPEAAPTQQVAPQPATPAAAAPAAATQQVP